MTRVTTPNTCYSTVSALLSFLLPVTRGTRHCAGFRLPSLAACLVPFFLAGTAQAQPQCNTPASIHEQLTKKYNERRISTGVTGGGALIQVYASQGGRTWSIVITSPNGLSCLVSAGNGWRTLVEAAGEES